MVTGTLTVRDYLLAYRMCRDLLARPDSAITLDRLVARTSDVITAADALVQYLESGKEPHL